MILGWLDKVPQDRNRQQTPRVRLDCRGYFLFPPSELNVMSLSCENLHAFFQSIFPPRLAA